jgi:signal peptidase II
MTDLQTDDPDQHRQYLVIGVIAVIVLALDQLSKTWAVNTLSDHSISVVWTLQFNLARNTGTAFSVGRGNELVRFVPLAVLLVVFYLVWQSRQAMTRAGGIAIGMILGGAIGNLVDRALRTDGGSFFSGGVIDFIDFQWWPVFNVADMGVVCGGILLVIVSLWSERRAKVGSTTT